LFTTKDFLEANNVIGILALATAASGASQVLCTGINIARKTKYLALYTGLAAFLNVCLNAILIPQFGFIGAAGATATSYFFLCILYYRKSQQLYFSPYEPAKIVKIGILSCAVVLASTSISNNDLFVEFIIKSIFFLSFPFLCFLWKVYDRHEISIFRRELSNALKLIR
jgi:O-antigen/teichoic acid export membrane protein